MATRSLEIIGTFTRERHRFDATIIGGLFLAKASYELAVEHGFEYPIEELTIKGDCDVDDLQPNCSYRLFGIFQNYTNKRTNQEEKQFHFRTFVQHVPHTAGALIPYLAANGKGCGIGPAKARRLVEQYGVEDVLEICRTKPKDIACFVSIEPEEAAQFAQRLNDLKKVEHATLELDQLLAGRGFPRTLTRHVIKRWGNEAAQRVLANPYTLMSFRGVGFKLTDKLYMELGKDPLSVDRQALCMWYGMASSQSGDTWFSGKWAVDQFHKMIGTGSDFKVAIQRGREYGQISENHYGAIASDRTIGIDGPLSDGGDKFWLAEGRNAALETRLANYIVEAINECEKATITIYEDKEIAEEIPATIMRCNRCFRPLTAERVCIVDGKPYGPDCAEFIDGKLSILNRVDWMAEHPQLVKWIESHPTGIAESPAFSLWPEIDAIENISDHQREVLRQALVSRVSILAGSPGTGKTYVAAQLLKAILKSNKIGAHEIGIGAPTGKAAVRLTELMTLAELPFRARTEHSLLGIGEQDEAGNWSFKHNRSNPWPYRLMVFDEQSMDDLSLMHAKFAARQPGCHVLLIGDTNQLPPVGNGAPLRDMIKAGISCGELREIRRNSGGIVEACADMRDGKKWRQHVVYEDGVKSNLRLLEAHTPEGQLNGLISNINAIHDMDKIWDVQVLVAVNKSSPLARKKVNQFLQGELNPGRKIGETIFSIGDKVVCLKNGFYGAVSADYTSEDLQKNDKDEVFVANGELGAVEDFANGKMVIKLDSPERTILVPIGKQKKKADSDSDEDGGNGCDWDLGYALSCHKSQGSEFPYVFILIDEYPGARMICDRSWIYTAISRAKLVCYLVGKLETAEKFCRTQKINERKTFLRERICLESFALETVGL